MKTVDIGIISQCIFTLLYKIFDAKLQFKNIPAGSLTMLIH